METSGDLLLHPVRFRIVRALAGGQRLSPNELAAELTDVGPATLYRHIKALANAGAIAAVEERPARGTPERVYALVEGAGELPRENLTREDHLRYFTMFLASLLGDFGRYLSRDNVDFLSDGVGYRQLPLALTDQEFAELTGRLNAALAPVLDNRPSEDRKHRMLTTIVMPSPGPPT